MTSKSVALLLADLGVTKTHSRPHVSNDNPFSESAFKTLEYRPGFPERFMHIEHARERFVNSGAAQLSTSRRLRVGRRLSKAATLDEERASVAIIGTDGRSARAYRFTYDAIATQVAGAHCGHRITTIRAALVGRVGPGRAVDVASQHDADRAGVAQRHAGVSSIGGCGYRCPATAWGQRRQQEKSSQTTGPRP
jgi:hypothetical protein